MAQTNRGELILARKWCHRTICLAWFQMYFMHESSVPFSCLPKRIRPIFIRYSPCSCFSHFFFSLVSPCLILRNEQDEAFADTVSQIKPTTVTLSYLWVLNYKWEVTLNVLPLHVRLRCCSFFSSSRTRHNTRPFVCFCECVYHMHACIHVLRSVCTLRIRGPSICSFAICARRGNIVQKAFSRSFHFRLPPSPLCRSALSHDPLRAQMLNIWAAIKCFHYAVVLLSRNFAVTMTILCIVNFQNITRFVVGNYTLVAVAIAISTATIVVVAAVIIVVIIIMAHIVFRCASLSRNKQLLN